MMTPDWVPPGDQEPAAPEGDETIADVLAPGEMRDPLSTNNLGTAEKRAEGWETTSRW